MNVLRTRRGTHPAGTRLSVPRLSALLVLVILLLGPGGIAAAQETEGGVRRFALFVGANDGGAARVQLRYAVSDASRLADVMYRVGGVAPRDALLLRDPDPLEIATALARLERSMTEARTDSRRVELLFYYSGHSDTEGLLLGEEMMPYRELRDSIEAVGADVSVALLDSCSSGSFTRLKGGRRAQPFLFDDAAEMTGYAFLTSSSDTEASQESDEIAASFFTHYLVSGLLGAADTTGDGKVTLNEAYQHAFAETLSRTSRTFAGAQHPSYEIQLTGAGDLVLTDLTARSAALAVDASLGGRVYVHHSSTGRLVAEFEKYPGQNLTVSLAGGAYRVDVRQGDLYRSTEVQIRDGAVTTLREDDFQRVALQRYRTRGDEGDVIADHARGALATVGSTTRAAFGGPGSSAVPTGTRPPAGSLDREPLVIELWPGRRWHPTPSAPEGTTIHNAVFGIVAAEAGHTDGVVASFGVNMGTGVTRGVETSYVGNIRDGRVMGVQNSTGFNIHRGDIYGVQNSTVFNVTDGNVRGVQSSSVFNVLDGSIYGVQGAGVLNAVGGQVRGVQAGGVVSLASEVRGVQTGVVTIAGGVAGVQAGVVNLGRSVRGVQLGVVNIAERVDGITLGVLNLVRFGVLDFSIALDDRGMTRFALQHGTEALYTIYEFAVRQADLETEAAVTELAAGLGTRVWSGFFVLDVDLLAKRETDGPDDGSSVFPALRATGGLQFGRRFAVIGGITFDGRLDWIDQDSQDAHDGSSFTVLGEGISVFPHYFAGIKL
jgi:hypothetical protein